MTPSKRDLEETYNINRYGLFVGQSIRYTTKVGSDMENAAT